MEQYSKIERMISKRIVEKEILEKRLNLGVISFLEGNSRNSPVPTPLGWNDGTTLFYSSSKEKNDAERGMFAGEKRIKILSDEIDDLIRQCKELSKTFKIGDRCIAIMMEFKYCDF